MVMQSWPLGEIKSLWEQEDHCRRSQKLTRCLTMRLLKSSFRLPKELDRNVSLAWNLFPARIMILCLLSSLRSMRTFSAQSPLKCSLSDFQWNSLTFAPSHTSGRNRLVLIWGTGEFWGFCPPCEAPDKVTLLGVQNGSWRCLFDLFLLPV